jgi:hypothetical protein
MSAQIRGFVANLSQRNPIQAAILAAVFQRALELFGLDTQRALSESIDRIVELLAEIKELAAWVVNPALEPSVAAINEDIDSWVSAYVASGLTKPGTYSEKLRKAWFAKPVGRRPEMRLPAVRAQEMRMGNPELTWDTLADILLSVEKKRSVSSPGQCLRVEVIALRRVLRKYHLPGSESFDGHRSVRRPQSSS